MSATYTYTRTVSFPGGINVGQFGKEVGASSIATSLESVTHDATLDLVKVTFADALSAGDQTTLAGLVDAHSPGTFIPFAVSIGESVDTTGVFSAKTSLSFEVAPNGEGVLLVWNYELRVDDGDNRGVEARVTLDGTVIGQEEHLAVVNASVLGSPKGSARASAGIHAQILTGGTHVATIEYRRSGSAGVAGIRRARMLLRTL